MVQFTPHTLPAASFQDIWVSSFAQLPASEEQDKALQEALLKICREYQVLYAENIAHPGDWLCYRFFCTLFAELFPDRNAKIIDWGGLYGHITLLLRQRGYENCSNYLLKDARYERMVAGYYKHFQEAFSIPTLYGDKPDVLALEDNSCDIFLSSGVLEHVRDEGETTEEVILREVYRVLKPEGALVIWNLPCIYSLSEGLAQLSGKWHHTYRYGERDIVTLLESAGFSVSVCKAHKFLPGTAFHVLSRYITKERLLRADDILSGIFPFSLLARDFFIIAEKREP